MRFLHIGCAWFIAVHWSSSAFAQSGPELAGDKFEHVTTLREMPADQMGKVMNIMSEALGVNCAHCHKGYDFASEDAAKKAIARKMISMTLALNRDQFGGRTVVTCMTCHQGQATPPDAALPATLLTKKSPTQLPPIQTDSQRTASDENTTVERILEGYHQAIGIEASVSDRGPVTFQAKRMEPDGKTESVKIVLHSNKYWEQTTVYERVTVTETYRDGQVAKKGGDTTIALKAEEQSMIKVAGHLVLGLPLNSLFEKWTLADPMVIGDKRMRVLKATEGELTHLFLFDEETGLLRRRRLLTPTVLGTHVADIAYDDYQTITGRRLPMKTTFAMPSVHWQIELSSTAPSRQ